MGNLTCTGPKDMVGVLASHSNKYFVPLHVFTYPNTTRESEDCNTQIFTGPLYSCSEKYSWQFFNNWMDSAKGKRQTIVEGGSKIVATRSIHDNYFFSMRNVVGTFTQSLLTATHLTSYHLTFAPLCIRCWTHPEQLSSRAVVDISKKVS